MRQERARISLVVAAVSVVLSTSCGAHSGSTTAQDAVAWTAPGDEWVAFTTSANGDVWYIDPSTISVPAPTFRRVWVFVGLSKPNRAGTVVYDNMRVYHELDCGQGKMRILQAVPYRGKQPFQGVTGGSWRFVTPSTLEAQLFQHICGTKRR